VEPTWIVTFGPSPTDRSAYPACEVGEQGDGQETQGGAIRVELFEIRREHAHGAGTIRRWRRNWEYIGGWCDKRQRVRSRRNAKLAVRNEPSTGR
jgi:hypothetical protein